MPSALEQSGAHRSGFLMSIASNSTALVVRDKDGEITDGMPPAAQLEKVIACYFATLQALDEVKDCRQLQAARDLLESSYSRAVLACLGSESFIALAAKYRRD